MADPDRHQLDLPAAFDHRDEEAVNRWRQQADHRRAQHKGRSEIFQDYRLRVAEVLRDYTIDKRSEAPADAVGM